MALPRDAEADGSAVVDVLGAAENRAVDLPAMRGAPLRNDLKTPLCYSELVSESPIDGNRPDEILKQVQDDTFLCVLR